MTWKLQNISDHIQEITPINDTKEHLLGDECWCNPKTEHYPENIKCSDGWVRGQLAIVHNSADGREQYEPKEQE